MESGKTIAGLLIGVGIGTIIGVLFAPDKGTNTRKKIKNKGQDLVDDLKEKFDGLYQKATNEYENLIEDINPELKRK